MKLIAHRLNLILEDVRVLVDRLDFASTDEYLAATKAAIRDARAASASSWNLAYITLRPAVILLGILGHYLSVFLRIIAQHSVYHGWIAAKEGFFQIRAATGWFVRFQRDLPASAKYAEFGAAVAVATAWILRRHVRKHRYAERIAAWHADKKRRALRRYHNFVERVAKTSSFLALLLPHLMYAAMVIGLRKLMPGVITYFATRTHLCSVISFWYPVYTTISLLGRLSPHLRDCMVAKESKANESEKPTKSWTERTVTPSTLKQRRQQEIEIETLRVEVIDMLKYWVVYAVLLAIVRTGKLLPFIGHILNVTTDVDSTTISKGFFGKKSGLYTKLRLSGKFVEEASFVFFVWLCLMPASITGDEVKNNISNVLSPKNKVISKPENVPGKSRPVDILYSKVSPVVLATMNSSAFLRKRAFGESRGKESTLVTMAIQKLHSILDLLVLVRLIRKESQDWLITTIVESSALLPAVTTLLMPSYFTNYGVIYVSLIVPAGYSISSCDAIRSRSSGQSVDTMMPKIDDSSRYLQFWVVHAALSMVLASFAPLLAWVPLSTHATWLIWAYVQLQSSTRKIYGWFEGELGKKSLCETAVARSTRWVIAALPSNVKDGAEPDINNDAPEAEREKCKDD